MTVIFAATFSDCVAIGADTLRHNAVDLQPAGHERKIRRINSRVLAAKAGLGPLADGIWDALTTHLGDDLERAGPSKVAAALRFLGTTYFDLGRQQAKALGIGNPGLFLLVSGWETGDTPALHWLNFDLENFESVTGPGLCMAFGPDVATYAEARELLIRRSTVENGHVAAQLDLWAVDVVSRCQRVARHAVSFPADLELIDDQQQHITTRLDLGAPPDHRFYRRIS
ncbi:hypothetical protein [Azospirillum argentinense]|uniref:Proteasome-type protease n=1 Tax=Azospirillum brasilense TaxID=192 RepID=A0A4D8Q4A1_AZOBR|nr:hypothetical protein [Azospirillum argentinense]QCO04868.1 hypothetical protein D3867_23715 [Azospirillum argentinense]